MKKAEKKAYGIYVEYAGYNQDKEDAIIKASGAMEDVAGFDLMTGRSDISWTRKQKPAAMKIYNRLKAFKARMRFKLITTRV